MKLLAFETATEACSVAVYADGAVLERFEVAPRRHAELALPWAEAVLAEAGIARSALDAIAVGRGPGAHRLDHFFELVGVTGRHIGSGGDHHKIGLQGSDGVETP